MADVLNVEGLTVRYGATTALAEVSLGVGNGSVFALLGRNGAGKTSLVRCLLGLQKPTAGRAALLGEDVWRHRARLMARVGVVPEEPDAPREATAAQLARFCARLYPAWDGKAFEARLRRFGVPERVPFGALSKGQRSLTMLALALAPHPELLVLDDPTLGLDPLARRAFYEEVVGELADRGTTVFMTTHDLAGIEGIADRVGILRQGRLALCEGLEALKARYRRIRYGSEVTETRTEFGDELDEFSAVKARVRGWGVEAVVSDFRDDAFARLAARDGIVGAEAVALSLEEVFLAVVGEDEERKGETR